MVAFSLLTTLLVSCSSGSSSDVVIASASARTLTIAPAGTGQVSAAIDQAIVVERRATVTSVDVIEGAHVEAGQQLMTVYTIGDSRAVSTATNKLRADELALQSVSARDGAGAATTMVLLAQVAADRQALTDLKLSPTPVTSPIAGEVSALGVTVGAELTRTDVVMHVVEDQTLRVVVPVAAAYSNFIANGQAATLSVPGGSGQHFDCAVVAVGAAATDGTANTDNLQVTVELPNPGPSLQLGSDAYVRFPLSHPAAVAVNSLAVLNRDQQPFVFVSDGQVVRQRAVVVGVSDGDSTEILSGLEAGEDVVISGGRELADGDQVQTTRSDS